MRVDREQFLRNGYLIIRECIPPEQLESLRSSFEVLVDRQRTIWARERGPDDPPGGAWETRPQLRLYYDEVVDAATANTVEFLLHENTQGVSRQLLDAPDAAVLALFLMCSPRRDHGAGALAPGPASVRSGPGAGASGGYDGKRAGAGAVERAALRRRRALGRTGQPLSGQTRRPKNEQLDADPRVPLPESIPVELKAGDGGRLQQHHAALGQQLQREVAGARFISATAASAARRIRTCHNFIGRPASAATCHPRFARLLLDSKPCSRRKFNGSSLSSGP